jgi:hypothetical protein
VERPGRRAAQSPVSRGAKGRAWVRRPGPLPGARQAFRRARERARYALAWARAGGVSAPALPAEDGREEPLPVGARLEERGQPATTRIRRVVPMEGQRVPALCRRNQAPATNPATGGRAAADHRPTAGRRNRLPPGRLHRERPACGGQRERLGARAREPAPAIRRQGLRNHRHAPPTGRGPAMRFRSRLLHMCTSRRSVRGPAMSEFDAPSSLVVMKGRGGSKRDVRGEEGITPVASAPPWFFRIFVRFAIIISPL